MPGRYIPEGDIPEEEPADHPSFGEEADFLRAEVEANTSHYPLSGLWKLTSLADEISSSGISQFTFFQAGAIERSRELRQFKALNDFARKLNEGTEEEPDEVTRRVEENIWDLF